MTDRNMNNAPMLNAYPDSIGGTLGDTIRLLKQPQLNGIFSSFYILPSIYNTDLDRGFSVIDYHLNEMYATEEDLKDLKELGIDLKLDFILNHASVLSEQFQDVIQNGQNSIYKDFFINWNQFWDGYGEMTEEGYIKPDDKYLKSMFFRKPGLPILMVRMPDGSRVPYWNTFYQEVKYKPLSTQELMKACHMQYSSAEALNQLVQEQLNQGNVPSQIEFATFQNYREQVIELLESRREYLGQMDLNIKSPLVWEFYEQTLDQLSEYGASIVRLDAFAYAPKEPGEKNFLNDPGTWDMLSRVDELASARELSLLPEIHAGYNEKIYEKIAEKGYMTYDFFLPGLIIDALERNEGEVLASWAEELYTKKIRTVNMLGCHDGIPLLDLKGLISDEQIQNLIDVVVSRGGYVKNLHGQKNMYYQVNATYYSALGEDDQKMLLARALQLFMPGKPQVWYLDLFVGKNDVEAVRRAGAGGHKEINRTNLSVAEACERLKLEVVQKQIDMLKFRASFPAFAFDSEFTVHCAHNKLNFTWEKDGYTASIEADLKSYQYKILGVNPSGEICFNQ